MEDKKHEEYEKEVVEDPTSSEMRFTEISPEGATQVLEIDKRTNTDEEKKSAPKKALIVGGLALLVLLAAFLMVKSSGGEQNAAKKNITVSANTSRAATAAVPGFNPDYASKDLMASTANANINTMSVEGQQQQSPAMPGLKGNIPPYAPQSQSPIFGPTIQTPPGGSGGTPNYMDVPVTQQGSGTGGGQPSNQTAQKIPSGGGGSSFNSGSANAAGKSAGGSGSGKSGYLSNAGSSGGGGSSPTSSTPAAESEQLSSSAPASQSSYFLFTKAAAKSSGSGAGNIPLDAAGDATAIENNKESPAAALTSSARPPFGTMLPLQTLGAIDTLASTPLVRMILSRTMKGNGWLLERGTVFVGRATGGRGARAYVQVIGYLDHRNNSFVRIGGDLQGVDGAGGLEGERKKIGSRWLKVLRQIGDRALQTTNSYITRKNSGTNITLPSQSQIGLPPAGNSGSIEYVYVKPGSYGYFLVNDLPAEASGAAETTAPLPYSESSDFQLRATQTAPAENYLSDEEVIKLMSEGDAEKIKMNLPRIRPEYRQAVITSLK